MTDSTTASAEGPGKGKAFFDRAKTVAGTGNYDYAIDMYIEGLFREPFNMDEHKALRDTAMRRKIAGGKPAGGLMGPKTPYKGKAPKEAMLNGEWVLAKDVGHIPSMLAMFRNAVVLALDPERAEHKQDLIEVAVWIGTILREANRTQKSPKLDLYIELADLFEKIEEFNKASECIQAAVQIKPNDMELTSRGMKLAALQTLKKGRYEKNEDFKESIKDREQTKELLEGENLNKSQEHRVKLVAQAKADYEKNPTEVQVIVKYYKALNDMDDEESENAAIEMLKKAYQDTKVYRFKVAMGDIRIKQFKRNARMLKEAYLADTTDKEMLRQLEQLNKERLAFEVAEFHERAENFPTDMHVLYEYGARLYESHRFDEAIVALQQAQTSPKHRVEALHLLGRSFMEQKMVPEALDTFRKSIDEYDLAGTGDKRAKELYYWFGRALQDNGDVGKAIEVFSKITQWDIGYRDARQRLMDLRTVASGDVPPK